MQYELQRVYFTKFRGTEKKVQKVFIKMFEEFYKNNCSSR